MRSSRVSEQLCEEVRRCV